MRNNGLNIEEIRRINTIKVYGVMPKDTNNIEKGVSEIFKAYLTEGLGTLSSNMEDPNSLTQQIGKYIKELKPIAKMAEFFTDEKKAGLFNMIGSAFDLANEINYNYHYRYNGTKEFEKQIKCELCVKDDFIEDIIKPLWSLLSYVMPGETACTGEFEIYQFASETVKKFYNFLKNSAKGVSDKYIDSDAVKRLTASVGGWVDERFTRWGNTANDIASSISIMKKPVQLNGSYSHTRVLIGDYIMLDNVIITDVNFDIPYLFYEGGLFDKVTVQLTLKGNRKMSIKTYDWIRNIMFRLNQDEIRELTKGIEPLNNRFENSFDVSKMELKRKDVQQPVQNEKTIDKLSKS